MSGDEEEKDEEEESEYDDDEVGPSPWVDVYGLSRPRKIRTKKKNSNFDNKSLFIIVFSVTSYPETR